MAFAASIARCCSRCIHSSLAVLLCGCAARLTVVAPVSSHSADRDGAIDADASANANADASADGAIDAETDGATSDASGWDRPPRAPREPVFAAPLIRAAMLGASAHGELDWFDERPELDGVWPSGCFVTRESWILVEHATTIVRAAHCRAAAGELRSSHPRSGPLLRAVAARVATTARPQRDFGVEEHVETPAFRIRVIEQRFCIGHGCRTHSDPMTSITVVTLGHSRDWFERAYRRAFSLSRATSDFEGIPFGPRGVRSTVEFDLQPMGYREVRISWELDQASQERMRRWLLARRLATVTVGIPWQLETTRQGASIITIPPGHARAAATLFGRAPPNEPWPALE